MFSDISWNYPNGKFGIKTSFSVYICKKPQYIPCQIKELRQCYGQQFGKIQDIFILNQRFYQLFESRNPIG